MSDISRDDMLDLLSYIQSYDAREISEPVLAAWLDASVRARWDFDEALAAVKDHYARTTAFLMPGHITEAIRARRQQPPSVPEQRRALGGPPPASAEHIAAVMQQIAQRLGWSAELDRRSVLAVACPWCRAHPGQPCTRPARGGEHAAPTKPHPARREAAEEAQMDQEAGR